MKSYLAADHELSGICHIQHVTDVSRL